MTDNHFTIEIDGKEVRAEPGQMLIEVTDETGHYVPRFCYHHKLTVAANCRMCLVEVEKAPKPLPACATPVMDGMKVHTRSQLALEAQKSVMEFLLINHPLDCPICDQGGECELQDLAMGYGRDVSRYQEKKRVVNDKNIGPLVRTDMTRCIHCTRCVRFGEEIAGLRELGATGRGEFMEIGTYIEKSMTSELSGNVIDLCPVGALTSKPFRYSARTWEMTQRGGIAAHDAVGSNIHFHVKGDRVKRVVPAENEAINEIWLSDRDRFSYEGLYSDERLTTPMLKDNGSWREVDWETAFDFVKDKLGAIIAGRGADKIGALVSPSATSEELYLAQKFMRGLGSNNIDHRLRQTDFSDQDVAPAYPGLGLSIPEIEQLNSALIVGGFPRKDQPIINHRLRKAVLAGAGVMVVNPIDFDFNYDLTHKCIASSAKLGNELAAILKVAAGRTGKDAGSRRLRARVRPGKRHKDIADALIRADRSAVFIGSLAASHPQLSLLRYLSGTLAECTDSSFGYLGDGANSAGAWLVGAVPHRMPGAGNIRAGGLNVDDMLRNRMAGYLLLNAEPEFDFFDGKLARDAISAADCVVSITGYRTKAAEDYADVLLPMALYAENEGSYLNMEGRQQSFTTVVSPLGEARPAWKILRVLANKFELPGFNHAEIGDIQKELPDAVEDNQSGNMGAWQAPEAIETGDDALYRIGYIPMNSVDAMVRHAPALQQTVDVADGAAHINSAMATRLGVAGQESVEVAGQDAGMKLPLNIDDSVADDCVLIHGAHINTGKLGPLIGVVSITKA